MRQQTWGQARVTKERLVQTVSFQTIEGNHTWRIDRRYKELATGYRGVRKAFFADYDLSGYGILRLETLRQQAPCRVIPRHGPLQFACQLFLADRDLSGHGTACAGDRNQDDYPERCVRIGP